MTSNFHERFGRIGGLALIDILGSLLFIPLVLYILKWPTTWVSIGKSIVIIFILAEISHLLFQVTTPITSKIMIKR